MNERGRKREFSVPNKLPFQAMPSKSFRFLLSKSFLRTKHLTGKYAFPRSNVKFHDVVAMDSEFSLTVYLFDLPSSICMCARCVLSYKFYVCLVLVSTRNHQSHFQVHQNAHSTK